MRLTKIHACGHLYGEGGRGERVLDLTPFHQGYAVGRTIDLPGFVEKGAHHSVTYESHRFWIHFLRWIKPSDPDAIQPVRDALVVVHHGGGWEVWRADSMLADALARYGDDQRGLFKLCWALADMDRELRDAARHETRRDLFQAFVDGRLKKRKQPGRSDHKVWIEPPAKPIPEGPREVRIG